MITYVVFISSDISLSNTTSKDAQYYSNIDICISHSIRVLFDYGCKTVLYIRILKCIIISPSSPALVVRKLIWCSNLEPLYAYIRRPQGLNMFKITYREPENKLDRFHLQLENLTNDVVRRARYHKDMLHTDNIYIQLYTTFV